MVVVKSIKNVVEFGALMNTFTLSDAVVNGLISTQLLERLTNLQRNSWNE